MRTADRAPVVTARGLGRRFGGTRALHGIDLDLYPGAVHAIVGENGAGKSTFGRLISGHMAPSEGTLTIGGLDLTTAASPRRLMEAGVGAVTQEISLVECLSSASNVFLGLEGARGGLFDQRKVNRRFREMADKLGLSHLQPETIVGLLPASDQLFIELMRAMTRGHTLILLDEPTARLTSTEAEILYRIINGLARNGVAIVYISHFLDEVLQISDTISVFKDGLLVETAPASEHTPRSLIRLMLGSDEFEQFPDKTPPAANAPVVLRLQDLCRKGGVTDACLTVRRGEILGIAGLVGSGRSSLLHTIFGSLPATSGRIEIDGKPVAVRSTRDGIRHGIGLIPENRKYQGLVIHRSVLENMTYGNVRRFTVAGYVRRNLERGVVEKMCRKLGVKTASTDTSMWALSGGNQQKVLLGRWVLRSPKVFLADEPTRGVDVGSKTSIYRTLTELAESGVAVVVVSSEIEEIIGLSHRIVVMRDGRIVQEFAGDPDKAALLEAAFGATDELAEV